MLRDNFFKKISCFFSFNSHVTEEAKSMLNCYFCLSVYLTEKTTTVVTSISKVWLRTLFICYYTLKIFRASNILFPALQKKQPFSYISFQKLSQFNNRDFALNGGNTFTTQAFERSLNWCCLDSKSTFTQFPMA